MPQIPPSFFYEFIFVLSNESDSKSSSYVPMDLIIIYSVSPKKTSYTQETMSAIVWWLLLIEFFCRIYWSNILIFLYKSVWFVHLFLVRSVYYVLTHCVLQHYALHTDFNHTAYCKIIWITWQIYRISNLLISLLFFVMQCHMTEFWIFAWQTIIYDEKRIRKKSARQERNENTCDILMEILFDE